MSNPEYTYLPSPSEIGSSLRGTSIFIEEKLDELKEAKTRRFGPNRDDFENLRYLVHVMADEMNTLGRSLQLYDRLLHERGIETRFLRVTKSQFE